MDRWMGSRRLIREFVKRGVRMPHARSGSVDARVACDLQQPGQKRRRRSKILQRVVGLEEALLCRICRLISITEHAMAEAIHGPLVGYRQLIEARIVSPQASLHQFGIGASQWTQPLFSSRYTLTTTGGTVRLRDCSTLLWSFGDPKVSLDLQDRVYGSLVTSEVFGPLRSLV